MFNINLFAPTTAAMTSNPFDSSQYDSITVSADNLAGAETVTLQVLSGSNAKQITDIYGATINLTAMVSAVVLEGGPVYIFVKSVTAGLCTVIVNPKDKQ